MMDEECLHKEYTCQLQKLENSIANLNYREKSIATEWIAKLKNTNTMAERKVRNAFLTYFASCSATGLFQIEPFNKLPPTHESILCLRTLLPPEYRPDIKEEKVVQNPIVELYESLYDKGEFLSKQPVPVDGYFFVFTLHPTTKKQKKHKNTKTKTAENVYAVDFNRSVAAVLKCRVHPARRSIFGEDWLGRPADHPGLRTAIGARPGAQLGAFDSDSGKNTPNISKYYRYTN